MGVVYTAEDILLNRIAALKFLPKDLDADLAEHARFLQEAQGAFPFNHQNIRSIHTCGDHSRRTIMPMVCVEAGTMRRFIACEAPPLRQILEAPIRGGERHAAAREQGIKHIAKGRLSPTCGSIRPSTP